MLEDQRTQQLALIAFLEPSRDAHTALVAIALYPEDHYFVNLELAFYLQQPRAQPCLCQARVDNDVLPIRVQIRPNKQGVAFELLLNASAHDYWLELVQVVSRHLNQVLLLVLVHPELLLVAV